MVFVDLRAADMAEAEAALQAALTPGGARGLGRMSDAPHHLHLSLVSHTNVGKTTLARTLLGRDVGEVRDAPHVTEFADAHEMLRTPRARRCSCGTRPASATACACCGA